MKLVRLRSFWLSLMTTGLFVGMGSVASAAPIILYTAGVDTTFTAFPVSVPATTSNPHIPLISPGVTFSPSLPVLLNGLETGPLNGTTYGPGAYPSGSSTGGSTGWVNVSYTSTSAFIESFFLEVANVGDYSYESAVAIDNIRINGILLESFEGGLPAGTYSGMGGLSGAILNLAPTDGSFFAFLDTTGSGTPLYDVIDGTSAGSFLSDPIGLGIGDVFSFDIAFLTTDGTDTFHDYALAAFTEGGEVPDVFDAPGVVPEPSSCLLMGLGAIGLFVARRRRQK